jgi:branched-chain amino acid transport system substrate-binding protein
VTLAAREIGADAHVPCMNGGGLAPELLNKPYLHNTRVMPTQLSIPMTEFLIEQYHVKRLAITYWADVMGFAERDATYYYAPKWGIEVVGEISHKPLSTNYRSELARIKAAKPDAMGVFSIGNDTAHIRKQALEMGLDVPMGTCLGINPVMIEICGEEMLKGLYDCSMYFDPKSKLPFCQNFVKNYNARYGEDPERLAANYYELVIVLRECIRHVLAKGGNPFDGAQLEAAIQTIKVFPSLYGEGKMELRPDGSIIKPVAIFQYRGGKASDAVVIKEVMPPPVRTYPKH